MQIRISKARLIAAAIVLFFIGPLTAALAQSTADPQSILSTLHFRTGKTEIVNGIVELNIGPNLRYLDSNDATTLLTKVLGNPASAVQGNLGLIVPSDTSENWFAVLSYSADGHVSDSDEANINYDDLLTQIKTDADEDSKQRRTNGQAGYQIQGWAQKPYYDSVSKKLYWAKSLTFDGEPKPTLNYDVRVLVDKI